MSVYVDELVDYGVRIGRAGPWWCHLVADSEDELHAFAKRIGMARSWFQSPPQALDAALRPRLQDDAGEGGSGWSG